MQKKKTRDADDAGQPPRDLPASTAHPELRYELADELVAHNSDPDPTATIRSAPSPSRALGVAAGGPVYRRVPGGDMVVPTGRVLVRFADGDAAADHKADLQSVGYIVERVLPYATNTALVRAATGDIAAALRGLDQLSEVAGVVVVEPQMIGSTAKRD